MKITEPTFRPIDNPDDSPIFVVGTGRSGTTLLRQMLTAHPRIHITHEGGFYFYDDFVNRAASGSETIDRYFDTFSFAWMGVDPDEVRAEIGPNLPSDRRHEGYAAIMRQNAHNHGKVRFGDKNPLDTKNLGRIFKDYKDPRIIYIMRDPRPTVMSLNRVPFGASSTLINSFLCSINFSQVTPYHDRILEVRLEDLTDDPRRVMNIILSFVGEAWSDAVLDHVKNTDPSDLPPVPWFEGASRERPSSSTSDGGWKKRLDPAWIRIIERINRKGMAHYGYAAAQLEREPTYFEMLSAIARDLPGAFATAPRLFRLWRHVRRHFHNQEWLDPQRGIEDVVSMNPAAWKYFPGFVMPRVPKPLKYLAEPPMRQLTGS